MSGNPAARLGDPTSCPVPGHGANPIANGSPNVFFDGLPAARQGDASACGGVLSGNLIPNVLINGKPAAVLGSVGSHGNLVIGGSGTVIIGNTYTPAPFTPSQPLSFAPSMAASTMAAVVDALIPSAEASEQKDVLDYRLELDSAGNHILTPLEIPDYDELPSGSTKNRETIDFLVSNRGQPADSLTLEVLDGGTLIYAAADTTPLLPPGEHTWQWDGYNLSGILDTRVLKSAALKVRLTAIKGGLQQVVELPLTNKSQEVDWVDARIDRNSKEVEVTVRPSFSDGGVEGENPNLTPLVYSQLETMAKQGIELHWSRNGTRPGGIGNGINTSKGTYRLTVIADLNGQPKAKTFPLTENLTVDGGRATSLGGFRNIHHNLGNAYYGLVTNPKSKVPSSPQAAMDYAREDFSYTAAHEFGHFILNSYGDGGLIPSYSWTHKGTSTLTQDAISGTETPRTGEVDVMHYFEIRTVSNWDLWSRTVAAEVDAKGLIWLARVKFDA